MHTLNICKRPSPVSTCKGVLSSSYAFDIDLSFREVGVIAQALYRKLELSSRGTPDTTNHYELLAYVPKK